MKTKSKLLIPTNITRRSFIRNTTATGLFIAGAASFGSAAKAAPNKGGTLRLATAHGESTNTLDPAYSSSNDIMAALFQTLYSTLTEVNNKGSLEPLLAESYSASPDAVNWTFKIRSGVSFHSGKPLTVEDVIGTLQYHGGEESPSPVKGIVDQIEKMSKTDDHTLVITLKSGNADFPAALSAPQLGILPVVDGKVQATGDGTGSYKLENFEAGIRAELSKNADYFKSDRGHFDSIQILTVADPAARQTALVTGEVDLIDRVEPKTAKLLAGSPGVEVLAVPGTLYYSFPMRTDMAPFDNNDARLAMKYAVNREEMVKKVLRGFGTVGNDNPISAAYQFYDSSIPQRQYDPDKAAFHAKKAGIDGAQIDLSVSDAAFAGSVDAGVLMQESAKAAGININVVREPSDGYWSNVWMKKTWSAAYWSGRPTADWIFTDGFSASANWNDSFWQHDRFNELLVAARAELDEAKRGEMYAEMQLLVSDEGGVLVPMFANHILGHSDKLAHEEDVAGNWDKDGGRLFERWWFA